MSWSDIENAMHAAIARASGYDPSRVAWAYQDVDEPALDHIVLNFGGEVSVGLDWVRNDQDLNRPNGQELRQTIEGIREVPFTFDVFTTSVTGEAAARRVAEQTRARLRLDSVRFEIRKVGVSVFDSGRVTWVPDIPSANFRGRASCTLRCYVPIVDCFEYVGYVARVRGVVYPTGFVGTYGASGIAFDTSGATGHG